MSNYHVWIGPVEKGPVRLNQGGAFASRVEDPRFAVDSVFQEHRTPPDDEESELAPVGAPTSLDHPRGSSTVGGGLNKETMALVTPVRGM
jgi:hypothetical protein